MLSKASQGLIGFGGSLKVPITAKHNPEEENSLCVTVLTHCFLFNIGLFVIGPCCQEKAFTMKGLHPIVLHP